MAIAMMTNRPIIRYPIPIQAIAALVLISAMGYTLPVRSKIRDPLLPQTRVNRPLTPLEKRQLRQDLEQLHQEALGLLQQGNQAQAFELWQRELRLQQVLGVVAEVRALGRVGEIAWSEGESSTIRCIIARLDQIQVEIADGDQEGWRELGVAYQQLRSPQSAIQVYQHLLEQAITNSHLQQQKEMLAQIAQTHLNWFDYAQAIKALQDELQFAQTQGDLVSQIQAYRQLAYCYEQLGNLDAAIETRLELIPLYDRLQQRQWVPAEQMAIAHHYHTLGQLKTSTQLYEQAYFTAFELQHWGQAADALQALGNLYQQSAKWPESLTIYQSLLAVQAQAYDVYGMMNTYEKLAQVYTALGQRDQALQSLDQGLKLSQQLKLKPDYFLNLIQTLPES